MILISLVVLHSLMHFAVCTSSFCPPLMEQESACSCFSYIDGAVIKCSGPNGPSVVEKLKSTRTEIRELSIQNANIIEVGPRAFRNLRVKSLNLDYNRVRSIHPDAFRGLENILLSLSVANNKLTEVPTDSLIGLHNLQVLNLKCNNIGDIYGPVFRNVSQLIELNLGCNQICRINGLAFHGIKSSLQSLILDQNCLQEIPAEALRNFRNLLALHLQFNQIQSIEKLQLMNLVSLVMIRLTGNKIRSVDRYGLTNVPKLRYLFLDQNELTSIEPNVLQQFKHLEIIDLSYNNIAEIPSDTFSSLEHLMQLNLEGNTIKDIAPGAFANTPLLLLLLSRNCLSSINQQMFQGIPFLRQLTLANNNIRLIQPLSFSHLGNMHMMDLSHNKIQVIQPGALFASTHVTIVLRENPLVCTQEGFHIMQGGQLIHLLNEPNVICKTDYSKNINDTCPTRKSIPTPEPCCKPLKPTSLTTTTTETTPALQRRFFRATTTSPDAGTFPNQEVHSTTTTPRVDISSRNRGIQKVRRINMDRFWRLQNGGWPNRNPPTRNTAHRTHFIRPSETQVKIDTTTTTKIVPKTSSTTTTTTTTTTEKPKILTTPNPQPVTVSKDRLDLIKPQLSEESTQNRVVPAVFPLPPIRQFHPSAGGSFQENSGLLVGETPHLPKDVVLGELPPWVIHQPSRNDDKVRKPPVAISFHQDTVPSKLTERNQETILLARSDVQVLDN